MTGGYMENPNADLSALMADDDRQRPRRLLEPWVRKSMKRTGLRWRLHHVREIFYLRGKIFKHGLKGLFNGVLSGLSYRTAEHVTHSYNDRWHSWQWWQPDERVNAKKLYMNWDDEGLVFFSAALSTWSPHGRANAA